MTFGSADASGIDSRVEGVTTGLVNYLGPMEERPYYVMHRVPEGTPWRNTTGDPRTVDVHDARTLDPPPSLDREGFAYVEAPPVEVDVGDAATVRAEVYPAVEGLVREVTGASRALAFDHNVRRNVTAGDGSALGLKPVRFAHNDYTLASGPQRVRDLLPDEAEKLLRGRVAVVNVWRPLNAPVEESPLAVLDARTIGEGDLVETDLRYADRNGVIYSLKHGPGHRWFFVSRIRPDEALLLKCYDSEANVARFTAHSAFDDPSTAADARPRESIEVRTLVFWDT